MGEVGRLTTSAADIPCYKPRPSKTKKRRCASCTTGDCSFYSRDGGAGHGGAEREVQPEVTTDVAELREALLAVRRMRTRCETALVYAEGNETVTLEAMLADAELAEGKLAKE